MIFNLRYLLFAFVVLSASRAAAQLEDPFGLGALDAQPAPPAAEAPPAGAPLAPAAQPAPESTATSLPNNPAVRAALEWPRDNPSHAFRAVIALVDLGHPELARPLLEELQARNLDDAARAALVEEFGSPRMLQLARVEALQPIGAAFADATMSAAAARATDPARLAQLVAELSDPSPEIRRAARGDLGAAGRAGAKFLLEALARESDPNRRANLLAAAAHLRPIIDGPLLAMLETTGPRLHADVANLLAQLQFPQAVPLIVPTTSPHAEPTLRAALAELEQGVPPFLADAENQIELWFWNDASQTLTSARYPADDARSIWMARLAQRLVRVRPDSAEVRVKALAVSAEANGLALLGISTDPAEPLPQPTVHVRWPALESPLVNDVLAYALKSNYAHAAVAASDELARRGDVSVLFSTDAKPSPLAAALTHGNRRIRFAALRAIMTLDPRSPYPGSSRVPDALAYFAGATGGSAAIVAMPSMVDAADVAGKLSAANMHGEPTMFGSDVPKLAQQLSDLELILVDADILSPGVRQVLYELRITPASAHVPVAVLAADGRFEAAQKIVSEHQRMIAVPRPQTPEAVAQIAARLKSIVARESTSAPERAQQAVLALTWTANLLERGRTFYALRRESTPVAAALYRPATTDPAIDALARFHTPESQRALIAFASQRAFPIEARRKAAAAFDASVRMSDLLLTSDEILAQYAIYNASETADADTQQVLGAILDTIEARTRITEADAAPSN
jgi:hypothetical protein